MNVFYAYKDKSNSHKMLLFILDKFYGVKAEESDISLSKNGKPFITKTDLCFNITHTDGLIMIAVSKSKIGIDAEWTFRKVDEKRIAEKYYSSKELEQIKTSRHFYILWTKKESAIKYADLTLASALKKTSFDFESPTGFSEYDGAITRSYAFDDYVYSITAKSEEFTEYHTPIYIM